jgi:hypothetical protein
MVSHQTARDELEEFIPVRKSDLLAALVAQGGFVAPHEREKFERIGRMVAAIHHFQYFDLLERLRNDYYYFNPEVSGRAAFDSDQVKHAYNDLVQSLEKLLKDANFKRLSHEEIDKAHRQRTVLRVEVKAQLDDFREVRFYRRGQHTEQFEVAKWLGLRQRKVDAEVYDDVVVMVATKSHAEIGSKRRLRRLERRKIVPGSVLLKYFRNIASGDLFALIPNIRVVMSGADKFMLGVPAIIGGIPILLKIAGTIAVLFVVIRFYMGADTTVEDKDMKAALAALTALVALGGFFMRQWLKFQRQSLKYQVELTDNVYFRNINNNAGIFDYIVGAAEDQEGKEALLAYCFLRGSPSPLTAEELDGRIEAWLRKTFALDLDFKVNNGLARLDRFGLLHRDGQRLFVSSLDGAIAQLQRVWDDLFMAAPAVAVQ